MKKTLGILIGFTAVVVAGLIFYRRKNRDTGDMSQKVSDEGYETAHDVLFPTNSKREKGLRYGPVLPN